MALEVEDGTGKATAESFISVADADTYHANRGNTAWAALATATKEQSLRKASDYMEQIYRSRWKGWRVSSTQALCWPRSYVYIDPIASYTPLYDELYEYSNLVPSNIVPVPVQRACAELALRAASDDLLADLEQGTVREKVGPIEVEYDKTTPQNKRYPAIDAMLSQYLKASAGGCMIPLARA